MEAARKKPPGDEAPAATDAVHLGGSNRSDIKPFILIGQAADAVILTAMLRRAEAELRLELFAVEEIGTLLRAGRISAMGAVAMLRTEGVDGLVLRESPEAA